MVLHLPLGEALFFVYSAADFEVARLGRGAEKRGGLGALPHTKCTADSRALCLPCRKQENCHDPHFDTLGNGFILGNFHACDPWIDPKALKLTPKNWKIDPSQKARSDRLCRAL